jgi:hypothetical protein
MNLHTQTSNEPRSPEKGTFSDSLTISVTSVSRIPTHLAGLTHDQCDECFTDTDTLSRLGRECNMKVCTLVSNSML